MRQFKEWISDNLGQQSMVFVSSFSEHGNLLSQWRGYCSVGKGVSLGVDHEHLLACASEQAFLVGRCIYDWNTKLHCGRLLFAEVLQYCSEYGPSSSHPTPSQNYHPTFQTLEGSLLHFAALIKNPAFSEEAEWRVVSPTISIALTHKILFRPGKSTLVPHRLFQLSRDGADAITLHHVYLGPTPLINLSMNALAMLFARFRVNPVIISSQIPFREM